MQAKGLICRLIVERVFLLFLFVILNLHYYLSNIGKFWTKVNPMTSCQLLKEQR